MLTPEEEESLRLDREGKEEEDRVRNEEASRVFNRSDQQLHNDYWLAQKALQSGRSDKLAEEQLALAEKSRKEQLAQENEGSSTQRINQQNGGSSKQRIEKSTRDQSTEQAEDSMHRQPVPQIGRSTRHRSRQQTEDSMHRQPQIEGSTRDQSGRQLEDLMGLQPAPQIGRSTRDRSNQRSENLMHRQPALQIEESMRGRSNQQSEDSKQPQIGASTRDQSNQQTENSMHRQPALQIEEITRGLSDQQAEDSMYQQPAPQTEESTSDQSNQQTEDSNQLKIGNSTEDQSIEQKKGSTQQNGKESEGVVDDQFVSEAEDDLPMERSKYRKTDESTVEKKFEQGGTSMKNQSVQTDDLMKASTDVIIDYGEPWVGSAEELSRIFVVAVGKPMHVDSAHATLQSAQVRYGELKRKYPAFGEILSRPLHAGNTVIIDHMQEKASKVAKEILAKGPFYEVPEPKEMTFEKAPAHWADRVDETLLNVDPPKKKRKLKRKAPVARKPVLESDGDDDEEDEEPTKVIKKAPARASRAKSKNKGVKKPAAASKKTPAKRSRAKAPVKKRKALENDDEDDEDFEDVEVDAPEKANARPRRARSSAKNLVVINSDDEDQESEPEAGPVKKSVTAKKTRPAAGQRSTKGKKKPGTDLPDNVQDLLRGNGTVLSGKIIVISGTPPTLGRKVAEDLVRQYGGKVARIISEKANHVVLGDNPAEKQLEQIGHLSKETIDEVEFIAMLEELLESSTSGVGGKRPADDDDDDDDDEADKEEQPPKKRLRRGNN
ncbi:hypothetical protein OCU04_008811 [Sclerotinia nivalis]|uniref:BRCT domain-containing protein n=1 Tax=Sclerotinia nivalis TaxID=352851 RepID=A0A9X0AJT6_9HELO|nr:hypothetical protein OCU04_008811 [Sclerotinia nivalis]